MVSNVHKMHWRTLGWAMEVKSTHDVNTSISIYLIKHYTTITALAAADAIILDILRLPIQRGNQSDPYLNIWCSKISYPRKYSIAPL